MTPASSFPPHPTSSRALSSPPLPHPVHHCWSNHRLAVNFSTESHVDSAVTYAINNLQLVFVAHAATWAALCGYMSRLIRTQSDQDERHAILSAIHFSPSTLRITNGVSTSKTHQSHVRLMARRFFSSLDIRFFQERATAAQ